MKSTSQTLLLPFIKQSLSKQLGNKPMGCTQIECVPWTGKF
jgi:hypothetical protein